MDDRASDDVETAPLLGSPEERPVTPTHGVWRTVLSASAVISIISVGNFLSLASQTAILEAIVCCQYYAGIEPQFPARDLDFDRCKIEPIQSEVAFINGWKDVSETLPAILFAVPFGALADKSGRKKVLLLAVLGIFLSDTWVRMIYWFPTIFPVRAVWAAGWWQAIGAGGATLSSVIFAQVADVCPPQQRTAIFSLMASADLITQLVFIPVGAALMAIDPWIPMFIASALGIIGLVFGFFCVPETLPTTNKIGVDDQQTRQREDGCSKEVWDLRHQLNRFGAALSRLANWTTRNMRVVLVMTSMFCFSLALESDRTLLLQYASKRLGWTIGEASYLLSFKAGVSLFVMAILLPAISSLFLVRLGLSQGVLDKHITEANGICLALGAVIIGLSTSWILMVVGQIIFSLGYAFTVSGRSLVANMVEKEHRGLAFTVISIFLQAGFLIGSPLLAAVFRWGMKLGDFWMGLPFLVSAGFSIVGTLVVVSAKPRTGDAEEDS